MKLPALIVTLIVTVTGSALLIAAASPQNDAVAPRKVQQDESARKVKELQKEQLVILRAMAEVTNALYHKSRADADQVFDAQQLLLRAEVEFAEKDSDRIKLYEEFVEVMKEYEALASTKKEAAQGTLAEILQAKAIRLEAEIDLEQLRAKAPQ